MARVIILRDLDRPVVPQKYRGKANTCVSFQHASPKPRSIIDDTELALLTRPTGHRFFNAREKRHVIPEFSARLEDQWHHHDDNIVLRVAFKGFPEPVVTWFKDQQPVCPTMRVMVYAGETSAELMIMDAQKADTGFYTCRIENSMGVRESHCQVYIGDNERLKSKGHKTLLANSRLYRSTLYRPGHYYSAL